MHRRVIVACWLLAALSCGVGDATRDTEGKPEAEGDDRGPLGKTDENGSCASADANLCGAQSGDGCWCDDMCEEFGDCCADVVEVCGGGSGGSGATTTDTATGEPVPSCPKTVVLMGYWPPTNEMLRPWSTNPEQNPEGWQGDNWRDLGYDVHAFFPEFPPDGDPTNDDIGEDGAVGSPDFDLRVDYQATSADFWRIVDELDPIILITTSRGGQIGWEVEAIEGGHGAPGQPDPAFDWRSDGHGDVLLPTEATIEPRSWDAISEFRQGVTVSSSLPMDAIVEATSALDLASVEIDQTGTSGDFLSGFLGLHGIVYHQQHAHNVAAGHIHVGIGMPNETARTLMEATVEAVIAEHPSASVSCP